MKIYKTDDPITALAKRGAMICQYAILNPFHVSFEDGNFGKEYNNQQQSFPRMYRAFNASN